MKLKSKPAKRPTHEQIVVCASASWKDDGYPDGGGTACIAPDKVSLMLIVRVAHLHDDVLEACSARARAMLGDEADAPAMASACARAKQALMVLPGQRVEPLVPEFDIPRAHIFAELLHSKYH